MAGLPAAPTRYSPFGAHPELSKGRQEIVLRRMVEDDHITEEEKDEALKQELKFAEPEKLTAPHFALWVKEQLAEKYGVSFLPFFGVNFDNNENGNILYVPVFFNGQQLHLHKACAVKLIQENKKTRLSLENVAGTFACGAGFGLNHPLKSMNPNDMKNPDFLVIHLQLGLHSASPARKKI